MSQVRVDNDDALNLPITDGGVPGAWWGFGEGRRTLDRIHERISGSLAGRLGLMYGANRITAHDVTHTAVMLLSQRHTAHAVSASHRPWAYLYAAVDSEMRRSLGDAPYAGAAIESLMGGHDLGELPYASVGEAALLTSATLSSRTPASLREALPAAVLWLAENCQRISHFFTSASRSQDLLRLGFSREQILALANAVLGSRRGLGVNSLLVGFMINPEWDPWSSPEHRKALRVYRDRMRV